MDDRIKEALDLLDHSSDDHWDARSGKPKLAVIRQLAGDPSITREQLDAYGVVREKPDEPEKPKPQPKGADDLRKRLRELETQKAQKLAQVVSLKREADRIESELVNLRAEYDRKFPPMNEAEKHKQWARVQTEARRRRIREQRAAAAAFRDARSPLDRALAASAMKKTNYPLLTNQAKQAAAKKDK